MTRTRPPGDAGAPPSATGRPATDTRFAELFREHYPQVVRLAYLYCGDRHAAEDAAADAMAKVYLRWRRGQVRELGPYLRRAVINEVRGHGRHRGVVLRFLERRQGDDRGARIDTDGVEDRDEMIQALQQLPEGQRMAVVLRYYEQLSEAEAADVMGVTVGGVKSQTSRGLDHLRALLTTEEA